MLREEFIKQKKENILLWYDNVMYQKYDSENRQIEPLYIEFINHLLNLLPSSSKVLDAGCGTGRFFHFFIQNNHEVIGYDQSIKMIECAKNKYPDIRYEIGCLEKMGKIGKFKSIICIDTMNYLCPEDWENVFRNFNRLLDKGGYLYFTADIYASEKLVESFEYGKDNRIPIIYGEDIVYGRYHFYPTVRAIRTYLNDLKFIITKEYESDKQIHFIVKKK